MDYEWDAAKAAEILSKHGIDFTESIAALKDPNRLEEVDTRFDYGKNGYGSSVWPSAISCSSS